MPTDKRNDPHGKFNFLVDLRAGNTEGPRATFQECNIGIEVTVRNTATGMKRKTVSEKSRAYLVANQ
jgi:hypothetical protein